MGEKTIEEKITEYVWLHSDQPPTKIQAGILKEFGVERSLDWISKERQEYLNADEPSTEEHTATAYSAEKQVIQQIAKAFPSVPEKQIAEIIRLRAATRLGYRKIGQKLNPPVGKDTVMGILKMHQSKAKPLMPPIESPEVAKAEESYDRIKVQVAEQEYIKSLRKKTEELYKKDVYLRLENEGDDLLASVAEHEMEKISHETCKRFSQFCEREQLSAKATLQRMGLTAEYFLVSFEEWYERQARDGDVGMKALAWAVTVDVDSFLRRQSRSTEKSRKCAAKKTVPWKATENTKKAPAPFQAGHIENSTKNTK